MMAGLQLAWLTVCAMSVAILPKSALSLPLMPLQLHESNRLTDGGRVAGEANALQHSYHSDLLELQKHIRDQNHSCSNISYNGQKLSSHLCDATAIKSFRALQMPTGDSSCNIKFSIFLKPFLQERVVGADLALYKLPQVDANGYTSYKISIAGDTLSNFSAIAVEKKVPSTSHGWLVFSIDSTVKNWQPGRNNVSILLTGIGSDGETLPCSAVKSLFVMNSKEVHSSHTDKPLQLQNYVPVVTTLITKQGSALYCLQFPDTCSEGHRLRKTVSHQTGLQDGNLRQRRSCSNINDYTLDMFFFRKELRASECTARYNGQSVSQHHCTTASTLYPTADTVTSFEEIFCFIYFSIPLKRGETIIGADLSLYKMETYESYTVNVIPRVGNSFFSSSTEKVIPAGRRGWQVFHVNNASENLTSTALFALVVQDSKGAFLTCNQVSSLFVLNYQEEAPETEGSGAEDSELAPEDPYCEDYLPVVTVFYIRSGVYPFPPSKRSTEKQTLPSLFIPQGCQVQDHVVNFHEDYGWDFIIQPIDVNIGLCSGHCAAGSGMGMGQISKQLRRLSHCKPKEYSSLEVLIKINGFLMIEELPRFIIKSCTCDDYQ